MFNDITSHLITSFPVFSKYHECYLAHAWNEFNTPDLGTSWSVSSTLTARVYQAYQRLYLEPFSCQPWAIPLCYYSATIVIVVLCYYSPISHGISTRDGDYEIWTLLLIYALLPITLYGLEQANHSLHVCLPEPVGSR